ncbi:MAG: CBS domain-containing protein, partial [Deltaproteobacteria bacterium]|nr:CBS domain-containing protein [Deltaproteobacteria bacterium]
MSNETFYFLKVGDLGRRALVCCTPDDDVLDVADLMREKRVSGVVVCRDDEPVGIITDRDFRTRLRQIAEASGRLPASQLMSAPVTTIGEGELVFEAIYRMGRNRIHRLVVVDAGGKLAGIITDADLIKLQLTTPMYLGRDVEEARSVDDLASINSRATAAVSHAFRAGGRTPDVIRLISHFHDAITRKLIEL